MRMSDESVVSNPSHRPKVIREMDVTRHRVRRRRTLRIIMIKEEGGPQNRWGESDEFHYFASKVAFAPVLSVLIPFHSLNRRNGSKAPGVRQSEAHRVCS